MRNISINYKYILLSGADFSALLLRLKPVAVVVGVAAAEEERLTEPRVVVVEPLSEGPATPGHGQGLQTVSRV